MSTETTSLAAESPPQAAIFEAYHKSLGVIRAVPTASLLPINLDVLAATSMATGAAPKIAAFRHEVEVALPLTNFKLFDNVPTYAMALAQANCLYLVASTPKESVQDLNARGEKSRAQMLLDLTA